MGIFDLPTLVDLEVPRIIPDRNVSSAPEKQGDVQEKGEKQGYPHPQKSSEESVEQVLLPDPAPVLANTSADIFKTRNNQPYWRRSEDNV